MEKIKIILNRPFPLLETKKEKIFFSFSFGIFISLFLLIFQPFGTSSIERNKILYLTGFGFITTIVMLFNFFITMNSSKVFFSSENWNVWKFIILNFIMIIPIAILNWIYAVAMTKHANLDFSFAVISFLKFIFSTITIGFFPFLLLTLYLEQKLRYKNLNISARLNQQLAEKSLNISEKNDMNFDFHNSNIKILVDDILCVKSMGNYVTLYFLKEKQLEKEIIRTTMKKIEADILDNSKIIRCHKSYFVNLNKVITTSGNARSLYLQISELDFQIPVSRNYSKYIVLGTI
ncbi:MAG: LytTR family transcriptional regulator [Ignavibacteriae bacterium]|nr:LytTR family transcriptional regulator [Ignavibacteriota bacterium]